MIGSQKLRGDSNAFKPRGVSTCNGTLKHEEIAAQLDAGSRLYSVRTVDPSQRTGALVRVPRSLIVPGVAI